eukprot:GHRR01025618.1.p3 GENE.GHRR01025618.1~~GHRR01025618.1.p3  ORF type:complete len:104 (-),score=23.65 GHRR01025618.1:189-500(-)
MKMGCMAKQAKQRKDYAAGETTVKQTSRFSKCCSGARAKAPRAARCYSNLRHGIQTSSLASEKTYAGLIAGWHGLSIAARQEHVFCPMFQNQYAAKVMMPQLT